MDRRRNGWLVVLALLAAAVIPTALFSNYHLFQLTMVVVYAIAILGLNIVTGYNGQISLGHGAFYAIGAYVTAILMDKWDVPYWATLAPSALVCGIVGLLIGGWFGGGWAQQISGPALRKTFAVFIVLAGLNMFFQSK